jgi:hypothetical protein
VAQVSAKVMARMSVARKTKAKNRTDAKKAMKVANNGTMKWLPFMSNFNPENMWSLIKSDV